MESTSKLVQSLKTLGLQEKEIAVYKASIALSVATVAQIAAKAEMKRTNTYNILRALKKYGFVSSFEENKKLFFQAMKEDTIDNYIQQQIQFLTRERNAIHDIREEIKNLQEGVKRYESAQVKIFEGKKAALQVWSDMLRMPEGETIYDIEAGYNLYRHEGTVENYIDEKDFIQFAERRIKKKIRVQFVSTTPITEAKKLEHQHLMRYTDALYIRPEDWASPVEIGVYVNKVYLSTYKKDPIGIIIENEDVAHAFKLLFDKFYAWALALPYTRHVTVE